MWYGGHLASQRMQQRTQTRVTPLERPGCFQRTTYVKMSRRVLASDLQVNCDIVMDRCSEDALDKLECRDAVVRTPRFNGAWRGSVETHAPCKHRTHPQKHSGPCSDVLAEVGGASERHSRAIHRARNKMDVHSTVHDGSLVPGEVHSPRRLGLLPLRQLATAAARVQETSVE